MTDSRNTQQTDERAPYQKKRIIVPAITFLLFFIFGIYSFIYAYHYQTTDDAFVEGHIISVAPKVAGHITKLNVEDNQLVNSGDLIAEIDPKDFEVKLKETEAELLEAKAQLSMSEKEIEKNTAVLSQSKQDLSAAESKLDFAKKDFKRYSSMYKEGISTKQDYDSSSTHLKVATSNYISAKDKIKSSESALSMSSAKHESIAAEIKRLEAQVELAKLNLSYTKIYAPQKGNITSRNIEEGNYVQIGQPLLAVVPEKLWITANFKETQLTNMQAGQKVSIKIDTYPHKKFKGKVDSIQKATGAKSSLFPPENAVGSYVKVVQRIPVKILFDEDYSKYNIVPGMSVIPEVHIR